MRRLLGLIYEYPGVFAACFTAGIGVPSMWLFGIPAGCWIVVIATVVLLLLLPGAFLFASVLESETYLMKLQKRLDATVNDSTPVAQSPVRRHLRRDWPRIWELWSFLLPEVARERVFEPAYEDFLEQYLTSLRYKGKREIRWLELCMIFRTGVMVLDTLRAVVLSKLPRLFPQKVREWWTDPRTPR